MKKNQSNIAQSPLLTFKGAFASIVAGHLRSMPEGELFELEQCAGMREGRSVYRMDDISARTCVDELSISDMLASPYYCNRASVVGYVDRKPVLYFNGAGIFQWSDTLDSESLSYWLTYPAYPPGWEID